MMKKTKPARARSGRAARAIRERARCARLAAQVKTLRKELALSHAGLDPEGPQPEAQRELELAAQRYADLFDFAPVAYLLLDRNGFIRDANLTATQLFGLPRSKLRGTLFSRFAVPADRRKLQNHLYRCRHSAPPQQTVTELDLVTGEGRTLAVQLFSVPEGAAADGGPVKICRTAVVDVSERKCAEATICRLNNTLEERVAGRTDALKRVVQQLRTEVAERAQAEQRLEESNRELHRRTGQLRRLAYELVRTEQRERNRLARVLHDHLQQLLVGARVQAELLRKQDFSHTPPELEKIASLLDESHILCRTLTVDLCPPVLHYCGLAEALKWLGRWMEENHGLKVKLHLRAELPPDRDGLVAFLFQAVRELLFNVQKHAGVREASVSLARDDHRMRVVVADAGVGFSASPEPSARAKAGFGLFSIRERVQMVGGQMTIESARGRGTRIALEVPPPRAGAKPASKRDAGRGASVVKSLDPRPLSPVAPPVIRVLLVDDHKILRDSLSNLLSGQPDLVVAGEAADGRAAITQARQLRPDVVVMDINMPGMDGIEATRVITGELPSVRVIGLSMAEATERGAAIVRAGAAGFVTKSAASVRLLAAIRKAAQPAPPRLQPRSLPARLPAA